MRRKLTLAAAAFLVTTGPAVSAEALGNLVISAFLAVGLGAILPAASANAVGKLAVEPDE